MTTQITDPLELGRYVARLAACDADRAAALALRGQVFRGGAPDRDRFDAACDHLLIERRDGHLCGTCRVLVLEAGRDLGRSYAAQFYDLAPLSGLAGPLAEIGRFCIAPGARDGEVLRVAWAALTRTLGAHDVQFLFGCASFDGTDPARHRAAFAHLARHHLAPRDLRPGRASADTVALEAVGGGSPDAASAGRGQVPRLLRSYLGMGGWVSDHAVIDRDLGTIHVFTGVETARIPPARLRALRALADGLAE